MEVQVENKVDLTGAEKHGFQANKTNNPINLGRALDSGKFTKWMLQVS